MAAILSQPQCVKGVDIYLKDCEQWLPEGIKVAARFALSGVKVEASPKQLHAKEGEDDDEQEQQQQQGHDGTHRVQQRRHQVAQGGPVPGHKREREITFSGMLL